MNTNTQTAGETAKKGGASATSKLPKVKTIDVNSKEWFDKMNGNSYFSSRVTINFGMKTERTIKLPMQYGYGSQDEREARVELIKAGYIPAISTAGAGFSSLSRSLGIIYRHSKQEGCKKADVKEWGI